MKYFFILCAVSVMLLHCTSGKVTSSLNKYKNIKTDRVVLYIYNGLVSTNVQTIELSRQTYARRRIDYTLRVVLQLENSLHIQKADIDIEGRVVSLKRPIYRNYYTNQDGSVEILLFFVDESLVTEICQSGDIVFTLHGKRGSATFALVSSHYALLSDFYEAYMQQKKAP